MDKLKNCPFCGGKPEYINALNPWIRCLNEECCATISTYILQKKGFDGTTLKKQVIDAWNRRV